MTPELVLELFADAAAGVAAALAQINGDERRARTGRPGQYHLDVVADAAALAVLRRVDIPVLSEESGWSGSADRSLYLVLDPVDGSTNASRDLPYWSTALCAVDGDGPLVSYVVNHATGVATHAVRGEGAWRGGSRLRAGKAERVGDALVVVSGEPARFLPWKQFRALGSVALSLCDLAAGAVDGVVDGAARHAPWDYLAGVLACTEAGAVVVDAAGRSLSEVDEPVRRQLVGAATPALLDELLAAVR